MLKYLEKNIHRLSISQHTFLKFAHPKFLTSRRRVGALMTQRLICLKILFNDSLNVLVWARCKRSTSIRCVPLSSENVIVCLMTLSG